MDIYTCDSCGTTRKMDDNGDVIECLFCSDDAFNYYELLENLRDCPEAYTIISRNKTSLPPVPEGKQAGCAA